MCHARFGMYTPNDHQVVLKLELQPEYPQQPNLLLRGNDGTREQPLQFLEQTDGYDYFIIELTEPQPFEYALRVTTPSQSCWITPKGEEHDRLPHNWFCYPPQSRMPPTPGQAALNPVLLPIRDELPSLPQSFETPAWVRNAVFYQIFVERFARGEPARDPLGVQPWGSPPTNGNFMGGNLQGILDRLDYLSDLGITALYLTPIFQSPSNHKYDTEDYFAVDPQFGDMELLRRLVEACHQRGLRVVLDGVFNHCSDQNPFFLDVKRNGPQSRYWNWFYIRDWPFPDHFGSHGEVLQWYDCWWGFHTLPKLNYHNPDVETYFLSVATYWLREAGVDGWRLDVPNEVIQSFWPKFRRAVKAVNPDAYIVGEIWDDASSWLQGDQFDAVMNYRFQKALVAYFAEGQMDAHAFDHTLRYLLQDYPEPATAVMLNLLGSHDTARPMTVVHRRDQGSHALESLKLMAAMQFTCTGAPCIYYGDEIGMEGDKDPDCRRCYPWDWEQRVEESGQQAELLAYYKKLIAVRKNNPALRDGTFRTLEADPHRQFYAFERHSPDNRCIVALNGSDRDYTLPLSPDLLATELLSNRPIRNSQVTVPTRQAIIVNLVAFDAKALARHLYWGGLNQTATARKLNERGMPHPAGRKWRQKDIAALV